MSPVYFRSSAVIHHDNVNSSLNFPWLQKFWVQYLLLHLVVVSISLRIAEGEGSAVSVLFLIGGGGAIFAVPVHICSHDLCAHVFSFPFCPVCA